ncbi:hypothetical protein IRJ41_013743 [Triplophysa rosa]|uniref:Uncharacterized protein n=1 Tax=Triplophysa rosa TaxID=992332 RepID=A0A9W7WBW5_TRIRA|nr:hypothetical protein IRJ41_013743 [Triplophysa rosa]
MRRAKLEIYDSPRLRPFLTTMSCFLLFILCDKVNQGDCELHVILQWTLYEESGGYGAVRINCVYTHIVTGGDNTFQPVPALLLDMEPPGTPVSSPSRSTRARDGLVKEATDGPLASCLFMGGPYQLLLHHVP